MIKEFAANTVAKAKEEVSVPNGIIVLIAVVSFIVGLVVGILCVKGVQARRLKKKSTYAYDYLTDFDFLNDEEEYDYEDEE